MEKLLYADPKIKIIIGEFGSGKTEFTANYALTLKNNGYRTAVVDMDLVKPYFRTRENRRIFEEHGIKVVAAEKRLSNAGLPVLPHELSKIFDEQELQVVIDVGGGESAIVLGQINRNLTQKGYHAWMVVNTRRPFTDSPEAIANTLKRIEQASRLKVTGLVCNTNLAAQTRVEHILEGVEILERVAVDLDLPIISVAVPEWLYGAVSLKHPAFKLTPFTRYPWVD